MFNFQIERGHCSNAVADKFLYLNLKNEKDFMIKSSFLVECYKESIYCATKNAYIWNYFAFDFI